MFLAHKWRALNLGVVAVQGMMAVFCEKIQLQFQGSTSFVLHCSSRFLTHAADVICT